jgi:hypothetical protein
MFCGARRLDATTVRPCLPARSFDKPIRLADHLRVHRSSFVMTNVWLHQLAHLALIGLAVFLYLVVSYKPAEGDHGLESLKTVIMYGSFGWTAWVAVMTVRHGIDKDLPAKLLSTYRQQLGSLPKLIVANIILLTATCFLGYHLLWYRAIDLTTNSPCDLILNDTPGESTVLTSLKPGVVTRVALRTGVRHLVARDANNNLEPLAPINVPPFWYRMNDDVRHVRFDAKPYQKLVN